MLSIVQSTLLALAVTSSVSAHTISPLHRRHAQVARATPPKGWATNYLEDYTAYHTRYLAIDCENKHNTTTFDLCCHPMLATETLAKDRNACCAPGATGDDEPSSSAQPAVPSTPASTATPKSTEKAATPTAPEVKITATPSDKAESSATPKAESSTTPKAESSTTPKAEPSTTPKAEPSTTPKSTATKTSTSQQSSATDTGFTTGGFGTWFTQNGVAGACGKVHQDTDFVVALQTAQYDNGSNCGRTVEIVDLNNGKTHTATVADECPTCSNEECLDMSQSLFEFFEALSVGEMSIKWKFTD
ncbi:barwin-like endoglucanase [Roridomyces roridus]|uniref:Barwin-like endoglucanase n=1 Tax=Roridomyces roridus TaxID=1738132 RepID=A0AAD7BWV2_9AGAR|nr:barwin-like endoglucanase [Roridomyces roridus]